MFDRLKNMVDTITDTNKATPTVGGDYTLHLPDGRTLDYAVMPSKRKSVTIHLSGNGGVIVKCPLNYPHAQIERFLLQKSSWVFEKQRYYQNLDPAEKPPEFNNGSPHMILGEMYTLCITAGIRTYAQINYENKTIDLETAPNADDSHIKEAVINLYKRTAEQIFPERLEYCFTPFEGRGHPYPQLTIKPFKGRWGSMSVDKKMMLNTWLVRAPVDCIDYVIIHELCHMEHMNHSQHFYSLQDTMCPQWKTHKSALDKIQITDI